jgi:hypothetical protein
MDDPGRWLVFPIDGQQALGRSLATWERKGCMPCAARIREQIATLERMKA